MSTKLIEMLSHYVMSTYSREQIIVEGNGSRLKDSEGREFLDFTSGISVCNLGHSHPYIADKIAEQARKLVHTSNLFITENQIFLAKKLSEICMDGKVFFCNSGTEANEGMIKLARKYGNKKERNLIIVMQESFHGRTLASLAATGREKYRVGFEPHMKGFIHVPFNDIDAVKSELMKNEGKVAAVMLEPIQGEGGIIPANKNYLEQLRKICTDEDILLMFDEVQTGMGRTGRWFAHQLYDVKPDVISIAKALGNGFPIGAFIADRKYADVLTQGMHASTFGGTPLACAAALAAIDVFEKENVLNNCNEMAAFLKGELSKLKTEFDIIKEIRGRGLMIGIELKSNSADVVKKARENGLLLVTAGEGVIRFYPPLNISKNDLSEGIEIFKKAISQVSNLNK